MLFQLPLGQQRCSIGLNVKYSVHVWETNPLFTFFFFDKKKMSASCNHNVTGIFKTIILLREMEAASKKKEWAKETREI